MLRTLLLLGLALPILGQQRGLKAISPQDLAFHFQFLGSREMRGRNTPTAELDIASKYLALAGARNGMKPLMPSGSYYQELPVETTTLSPSTSRLVVTGGGEPLEFHFPEDFTASIRTVKAGRVKGQVVFVGLGVSAPDKGWDDYAGLDVKDKVVVLLDLTLAKDHPLRPEGNRNLLFGRASQAFAKGALAVITVINPEREARMVSLGLPFDILDRLRYPELPVVLQNATLYTVPPETSFTTRYQVELRHGAAAKLLGLDPTALSAHFEALRQGRAVKGWELPGILDLTLGLSTRRTTTLNVVGLVEGRDPKLKQEYVVIGSHHDHLAFREGRVYPGADDNVSGCVAMLEMVKACVAEPPKRSVIFVWHTAEERGLAGALQFVQNCPVPLERISANLNLDMLSRNDPKGIYLVGTQTLSSELLPHLQAANAPDLQLKLDPTTYQDLAERNRFFYRSDHYPYILAGIPGVWIFSGTTPDYHMEGDSVENADLGKLERLTRYAWLATLQIANAPGLLKLDLHPKVTTRGLHNVEVGWKQTSPARR